MAKKRTSSARKKGSRKPSGRQAAVKGGRKKSAAKKSGVARGGPSPAKEGGGPKKKPSDRKRKPSGREKSGVRKAPERGSRTTAEMRDFFKPEGITLGLKFILTISALIFFVMIIFSLVIYSVSVGSLRKEMEDNGALMLVSVASIADSFFEYIELDTDKFWQERIPEGRTKADIDPEKLKEWEDDLEGLQGTIKHRYNQYLLDMLEYRARQSDKKRNTKVLNAMISSKEKGMTLNPRGGSRLFPESKTKYEWEGLETNINIAQGEYEEGGRRSPMVLFEGQLDKGRGKALVVMSAEKIARTRRNLLMYVVFATLIGILFGVGTSFILASAVSRPVNKLIDDITQVSKGNLGHKTVPTSKDEIGVLARTFDAMTQNLKVAHDREIENQAREHDLKIATEIQAGLLPSKIPEIQGYDVDAYYRPSKEVGGDYYDYIDIDEDHLGLIVADVSGKGIPGSMVMTMARSLLRMEAPRNLSTADTLKKVNKVIARDIRRGMFVTALYLILDIKSRKIIVSSAGHNPLVVYRKKTKKLDSVNPNGIALGFDKGPIFDRTIKEQEVALGPGDRVVMYTDGVVEAMDEQHEEYGDDRFFMVCQKMGDRNSNQFINILVNDLSKHQGKAEQHDDITISTFRVV